VPLCWSFAAANALMALLTHGGTVVLQERFDAEAAVRLIAAERCTVYYGMSHMAQAMLETPAWGHVDTHALCKDRQGSLRSSQPTVARPCSTEACRMHSEKAMQREGGHVVVIGGRSGIGLAAARLAQHEGAEVTIAGRSQERLLQVHQELGQVHMVMMDMTMRVPSRRSM